MIFIKVINRICAIIISINLALLTLFMLSQWRYARRGIAIRTAVLVPRRGQMKSPIQRVPPLAKPRYTRWWRALLLLGRYRLTRLP